MKIKLFIALILFMQDLISQNQMTLNMAVELALKNNLDLQIASNETIQAHNNNHPGNAGMLPTVSLNVSDNPSFTNINQKFTNGTIIERNNVFSNSLGAGLVFTYTLFDGRKMFATKRKLEYLDQAAVNQMNVKIQQVISSVVIGFSNIVRMNQYLTVLTQIRDLSKQRLEIINSRIIAGIANNTDLYLAQLDLETVNQNMRNQEMLIRNAFIGLNVVLHVKADSVYQIETPLNYRRPMLKSEMDSMLKQNPECLLAEDQYLIALQSQKEIASAKMPLIRFTGAYNYNLSQSQAGFSLYNQRTGPQAGLTLSVPLFTGNVNRVNIENELNVLNSELKREQIQENILGMYEQAWQEYQTAINQLASDSIAIRTAKDYMDLMQQRFSLGQNTIIELKEAQRTYEETYYRFISNQFIAKVAETQLLGFTGQLVNYN